MCGKVTETWGLLCGDAGRGGRRTKDCSQTWSFDFQFRLGKHFSDERVLPFYWLKIRFLEYLRISGVIRYRNGPISYWKKVTIWKEACIVHVGAVIHDYQGEGARRSKKCQWWKDCPGDLTSLNTDNVNFCTRCRPYQCEASRPSGPGRVYFRFFWVRLPPLDAGLLCQVIVLLFYRNDNKVREMVAETWYAAIL